MSLIAPTKEEFVVTFPAFSSLSDDVIEAALDFSSRFLNSETWGDFYSDAVGLDVAHTLSLDALVGSSPLGALQAAAGPVSSVSAAGVSTSFGTPDAIQGSKADSWYNKTVYGQRFLRLRDNIMAHGAMCS